MEHLWYKKLSTLLVKGQSSFKESNEKNIQNTFKGTMFPGRRLRWGYRYTKL